jgi:hypothetical protein
VITTETTQKIDGKTFINGVDTATICRRNGYGSRPREQIAAIQINAPAALAAKIVAALDEPAALVGADSHRTIVLFRTGRTDVATVVDFITDGKPGSFAAIDRIAFPDIAAFKWADDRSPLTVHRCMIPELLSEHVKAASDAVHKLGARVGSASLFAAESEREARFEKLRADIAASGLTAEAYMERQEADRQHESDLQLVAAHEGVQFGQFDELRQIVHGARYRVAKRAAEAATAATAA